MLLGVGLELFLLAQKLLKAGVFVERHVRIVRVVRLFGFRFRIASGDGFLGWFGG